MPRRPSTLNIGPKRTRFRVGILREGTSARGYDDAWKKLREVKLATNPLCECIECAKTKRIRAANVVNHIQDIRDRPDLRLDWDNLQSMHKNCHDRHTRMRQISRDIFYPAGFAKSKCKIVLIVGAPGSGKTTYAHAQATNKKIDIVIDLDEIIRDAFDLPLYHRSEEQLIEGIKIRNRMINDLQYASSNARAFITLTAQGESLKYWIAALKPMIVHQMSTTHIECIQNIRADKRRRGMTEQHEKLARDWYETRRSVVDDGAGGIGAGLNSRAIA